MKKIDLITTMPRCLAKNLALEIVETAHRKQPDLAIGSALAILSACSKQPGTDLIIFLVGESGQGKNAPLNAYTSVINSVLGSVPVGRVKSGMELIRYATNTRGKVTAAIDECGDLFASISSSKSDYYMREVGNQLLRMTTGTRLEASFDDMNTAIDSVSKKLEKLESKLKKDPDNETLIATRELVNDDLQWLKRGGYGVHVSFLGAIQPHRALVVVNQENMDSGLIGRSLFFFAPQKTPPLVKPNKSEISSAVIERLKTLSNEFTRESMAVWEVEAKNTLEAITARYEGKLDDDPIMRPVNVRATQAIERIANLISLGEKSVTVEAVEWARQAFEANHGTIRNFLDYQSAIEPTAPLDPSAYNEVLSAKIKMTLTEDYQPVSKILDRVNRTKECRQSNKSKLWKKGITWEYVLELMPENAPTKEQFKTITLAEVILLQMAEVGYAERKLPARGNGLGAFRLKIEQN